MNCAFCSREPAAAIIEDFDPTAGEPTRWYLGVCCDCGITRRSPFFLSRDEAVDALNFEVAEIAMTGGKSRKGNGPLH